MGLDGVVTDEVGLEGGDFDWSSCSHDAPPGFFPFLCTWLRGATLPAVACMLEVAPPASVSIVIGEIVATGVLLDLFPKVLGSPDVHRHIHVSEDLYATGLFFSEPLAAIDPVFLVVCQL